jgi:hypothetical protein
MDADAAAAAAAAPKKVKVKKTDVPVAATGVPGPSAAEVARLTEEEGQMQAADKLEEDTQVGGMGVWAGAGRTKRACDGAVSTQNNPWCMREALA